MLIENIEIRCPFCGKRDIEYGLALCAGCSAEIKYDLVERTSVDPKLDGELKKLQAKFDHAEREYNRTSYPFNYFAQKKMEKISTQVEEVVDRVIREASGRVNRRLAQVDAESIVTFSRGDRSIDVKVHVPGNSGVKVDFDVLIIDTGKKKIEVTQVVKKMTGLSLSDSIKILKVVPVRILSSVAEEDALFAKVQLEKLGAIVEIR